MRFPGHHNRGWAVLAAGTAGLAAGAVIAGGAITLADHAGQPLAAAGFMQGGGPPPPPAPPPEPPAPPADQGAPAPDAPPAGQQAEQQAPGGLPPGGF